MPIEDDYRPQGSRGHSPNGPSKAFPKQTTTAQITLGAPKAILNSGIGPKPDRGGRHQREPIRREHPQQPHLTHTATPTTSPTPTDKQARTPPSSQIVPGRAGGKGCQRRPQGDTATI